MASRYTLSLLALLVCTFPFVASQAPFPPLPSNLSAACASDLEQIISGSYPYTTTIVQSSGHFFEDWGLWDTCRSVDALHYCWLYFDIVTNVSAPGVPTTTKMAVCFPQHCSESDIELVFEWLNTTISGTLGFGLPLPDSPSSVECPVRKDLDTWAWVMVSLIAALAVFAVIATAVHFGVVYRPELVQTWRGLFHFSGTHYQELQDDTDSSLQQLDKHENSVLLPLDTAVKDSSRHRSTREQLLAYQLPSGALGMLLSFSIIYNVQKLFLHQQGSRTSSLNGLRTMAMFGVILGHTYSMMLPSIDNPLTLFKKFQDDWTLQVVPGGFFAVDTFFFLSGFLVGFLVLQQMQSSRGMNWFLYYFHRLWRLTPAFAFLLLVYWKLFPYLGFGPVWNTGVVEPVKEVCDKYWWSTMLYVQNFYPKELGDECMAWLWYLANDMQFYVVTPIFLIVFHHSWKLGWVVLLAAAAAVGAVSVIIVNHYDLSEYLLSDTEGDLMKYYYIKPYTRAFPYIVGLALAFILNKWKDSTRIPTIMVAIGYMAAAAIMLYLYFGPFDLYQNSDVGTYGNWSHTWNTFYVSFSRLLWAIALAFLVWACYTGRGGLLQWFLGHPAWVVPSRLTYGAYLIHPMVLSYLYFSVTAPLHYSIISVIYIYVGNVMISYFLAVVSFCLLERPMMNLEKLLLPSSGHSK